jgi:phospholipase/carboxylesterase
MMEHIYINKNSSKTVLALHGMGGSKEDMKELVEMITPQHNALLLDGEDFSTGMRRYFKRSSTGLDLEDLKRVAYQVANEIEFLSKKYGFDTHHVDVFGFSNGANMLLGMILLDAFRFRKGLALRPSVVNIEPNPDNTSKIRVHCGEQDPYLSLSEAQEFFKKFDDGRLEWSVYPGGHQITKADIEDAYRFLNA